MMVRQPRATIWLYKPRKRAALGGKYAASDRFSSVRQVDITTHLSDAGFRTTRTLGDPNGGAFQLLFDSKPVVLPGGKDFGDSLDGLIEPMDFIEIRGTGTPGSGKYPLLMRGFVKSVGPDDGIDGGSPERRIVVCGFDVGHVLQLLRVRYGAAGVTPEAAKALTEQYGIPFGTPPLAAFETLVQWTGSAGNSLAPADLVGNVIEQLVNPYLAKLFGTTDALSTITSMVPACSIDDGIVPPVQAAAAFDGRSVYEVLAELLDVGPFNELFVEDRDASLALVARPLPWLDTSGAPIGPAKPDPDYPIDMGSVIRYGATRSDAGVGNYYWVQRRADLINDGLRHLVGASGPPTSYLNPDYENANPTAFGWRFMEAQTAMTTPTAATYAPTAADSNPRQVSEEQWLTERRQRLTALNRDNVVLEQGSVRLRGDPAIKPGRYLVLPRGQASIRLYATSVTHEFSQQSGFTTTVQFSRGTGFLERASSAAKPWYQWRIEKGVR